MKKNFCFSSLFKIIFLGFGLSFLTQSAIAQNRKVSPYEDEYKNITTAFECISLNGKSAVRGIGILGWSFSANLFFYKKITDNSSVTEMRFQSTIDHLDVLEKEIFLNIAGNIQKISPVRDKEATILYAESNSRKKIEYVYLLNDETLSAISITDDVLLRVYVNDIPFDLKFSPYKLKELRSFIAID